MANIGSQAKELKQKKNKIVGGKRNNRKSKRNTKRNNKRSTRRGGQVTGFDEYADPIFYV